MEGLKKLTMNPRGHNILPVRHNYTSDGSYILSGLFIPAYRIVYHLIDKRGWCNLEKAKEYYLKEREKLAESPKDLLEYKSEYCFTIEEALIQQGDNKFPREELAEQLTQITVFKTVPTPVRGFLSWIYDKKGNPTGVRWTPDKEGNVQIAEEPLKGEHGEMYNNLYVGGIDSIDIGSNDSAAAKGTYAESLLSDFCIVIKKRVFGQTDPMYVAMYKERPKDPRDAYEIAAKLLTFYNCKAVLEASRTAILTHFRNKKYIHLLMKRPRATLADVKNGKSNMYGAPATSKTINHYIELIYDFALDYSYTIQFTEFIEQMLNYSDEKKKFFDIVAALGMCELGDEELSLRKPEVVESYSTEFRDVGWFTNEYGRKQYGVIPKNKEELNEARRFRNNYSFISDDDL